MVDARTNRNKNRVQTSGQNIIQIQATSPPPSTLPCPGHSTQIQADPGGSEWNGRNLVGIQVNSNLIPSKNNLIIQTQIFIHSRSFQVIPGGIQVKKRM